MSLTPLHVPSGYDGNNVVKPSLEKVRQLLDSGQGMKYLEVKDDIGETPLHYASAFDKSGKVVKLLIKHGANVEARDDKDRTPLIHASSNNSPSAALVLLRHGANINAQNKAGDTSLHYAFFYGDKEVAEIILNFVVDSSIESSSSLSLGLEKGLEEARNLVMNFRDTLGNTALDYAKSRRNMELIEWWESFPREKEEQQQQQQMLRRLKHRDANIESKDELQLLLSLYPNYLQKVMKWKNHDQIAHDNGSINKTKEWNQLEEMIRSYLQDVESIEKEYVDSLPTIASLQNDKAETYNRAKAAFDQRKKQLQQDEDEMNQKRGLERLNHRNSMIKSKDELVLLQTSYSNLLEQMEQSSCTGDDCTEYDILIAKIRGYLGDIHSINEEFGHILPMLVSFLDQQDEFDRAKEALQQRKKKLQELELLVQSVLLMPQSVAGSHHQSPFDIGSSSPTMPTTRETMSEEQVGLDPNHPIYNAIELEELEDFEQELIDQYGSQEVYRTKTMRDIVNDVITPICNKVNKSYAEYLCDKKEGRGGDGRHKKKADVFVTHCWDEPFYLLVAALRTQFGNSFLSTSFWICSFSIRQGDSQLIQDELNKELDKCPFVLALKEAPQFVVFRNSTTDLYSRILCVCELVFADKYGKFAEDDDGTTHRRPPVVLGDNSKFIHSTSSCLDASSSNANDKERILQFLLSERGARKRIDDLIGKLRKFRGRAVKAD